MYQDLSVRELREQTPLCSSCKGPCICQDNEYTRHPSSNSYISHSGAIPFAETKERCCFCLDEYNVIDRKAVLSCGHEFHENCIETWLRLRGSCPLCRLQIRHVTPIVNQTERDEFLEHRMQEDQLRTWHGMQEMLLRRRMESTYLGNDQERYRTEFLLGRRMPSRNEMVGIRNTEQRDYYCNLVVTALMPLIPITFILATVGIYIFLFSNFSVFGEFEFDAKHLESNTTGVSQLKNYRGVILHGDFRNMTDFTIGVKYKSLWNNPYAFNIEHLIFQVGLVRKGNIDKEMTSITKGIIVSGKSCERNGFCLFVQKETKVVFKHKVNAFTYNVDLNCDLLFVIRGQFLYLYYLVKEKVGILLDRLYVKNLDKYDLIAGVGFPFFARSALTFYGNLRMSRHINPKMHISSNGKMLANSEYVRSFIDFAIPDEKHSRSFILEYEIHIDLLNLNYPGRKDLFEVGIAPINLVSENKRLRRSRNTAFVQVSLQYCKPLERKFHIYTWVNGKIRRHLTIAEKSSQASEKYAKFEFQFEINFENNRTGISMYNENDFGFDYIDIFDSVEFKSTFYPSVGKGISLFPTKIFYSLRKLKSFFF